MPRKKKTDIVAPPSKEPWTAVERELIMADIAYLKQKEIESGAWAKWEESQKKLGWNPYRERNARIMRTVGEMVPVNSVINAAIFEHAVGRAPENDDLDRCNCVDAGRPGHSSCGWCHACYQPRFMCGHLHPRRRERRSRWSDGS